MIKVTGKHHSLLESLINYLEVNKNKVFITGNWIATLTDNELSDLKNQIKKITDTTAGIAITAYSAEIRKGNHNLKEEKVMAIHNMLYAIASIEEVCRKELVTSLRPLSIQPESSIEYRITEKGEKTIQTETDSITLNLLRRAQGLH